MGGAACSTHAACPPAQGRRLPGLGVVADCMAAAENGAVHISGPILVTAPPQ